jgi:hypothetical protein
MSGIATKTQRYVNLVKHTNAWVTDTRKAGLAFVCCKNMPCGSVARTIALQPPQCVLVKDNTSDRSRQHPQCRRDTADMPSTPSNSRSNATLEMNSEVRLRR